MLLFIITACIIWNVVLAFYVLRDYRLLLRVLRWSTSIYLIGFGIFIAEVLREGLLVNGHDTLHWDVRVGWAFWFLLVALSFADWRALVPAAAVPVWFLSYPEVRTLLNYGLVRLNWLQMVHSPLAWAIVRPRTLELARVSKIWADHVAGHVLEPAFGPVRRVLETVGGWMPWAGPGMEKLRPVTRWDSGTVGAMWRSW
ncbi:hypothetical protein F4779DRAFT_619441 [Xylariaceae sp. FL0662B]|nr:hypothetical protein F4779DRAFT_619441 [Xylariaceae sp. FL0662B]